MECLNKIKQLRCIELKFQRNKEIRSGIYGIYNSVSDKIYIGSSKLINNRLANHKIHLKSNKHGNCYLQNAFNKYGIECYRIFLIEEMPLELFENFRVEREYYWINYFNSFDPSFGYNLQDPKRQYTDERTKIKLSIFFKNCPKRKEHLKKVAELRRNRDATPAEHRNEENLKEYSLKYFSKRIAKFDKKTKELIEEYPSLSEAARRNNLDFRNMSAACHGKQKTCGGFIWKYL